MLTLADMVHALTGTRPNGALPVITEAVVDSRQVIPGALFVAMVGERVDGHEYVQEAFKRGAACALVQKPGYCEAPTLDLRKGATRPTIQAFPEDSPVCLMVEDTLKALQTVARYWRRKLDVKVIGITGSVGKSSTKEVVSDVLSQRYPTLKNKGNLNNKIGLPLTLSDYEDTGERYWRWDGVPGEPAFLATWRNLDRGGDEHRHGMPSAPVTRIPLPARQNW
jgi:UDP-N-acetylmuramoyl-tripeptide--D-alanyl-D-alanine ligase